MPLIPTEVLLDVNVVIASVFADHSMHGPARHFVETYVRGCCLRARSGGHAGRVAGWR